MFEGVVSMTMGAWRIMGVILLLGFSAYASAGTPTWACGRLLGDLHSPTNSSQAVQLSWAVRTPPRAIVADFSHMGTSLVIDRHITSFLFEMVDRQISELRRVSSSGRLALKLSGDSISSSALTVKTDLDVMPLGSNPNAAEFIRRKPLGYSSAELALAIVSTLDSKITTANQSIPINRSFDGEVSLTWHWQNSQDPTQFQFEIILNADNGGRQVFGKTQWSEVPLSLGWLPARPSEQIRERAIKKLELDIRRNKDLVSRESYHLRSHNRLGLDPYHRGEPAGLERAKQGSVMMINKTLSINEWLERDLITLKNW